MTPAERSKIEELKKSLYSRTAPDIKQKRHVHFSSNEPTEVPTDWQHPPENDEEVKLNSEYQERKGSFFTKLLVGSLIFFIVAMSIGAYLILNGTNTISANNIVINVNGPVTVAGGDPVTFDIQVGNKNNIKLEAVDLAVDFPVGSVSAEDRSKELKQFRETMNDIEPGGVGQKRVSAVIYGEENSKKQVLITVSYKVAGSNAVFKKQKNYEVLISSSPLTISVDSFKEVTAGQEFNFEVTLASNSSDVIKNLLLRVEYPFGFTLTSTETKAEGNVSLWRVGDIPPHSKKTIKFRGQLEGQDGEVRAFRISAGAQSVKNPGTIGTEYVAALQEINIKKPFMSTSIAFGSDTNTGDHIGSFNASIPVTVSWFNNLPTAINDGEITIKLSGNAFDKTSVQPGQGYYRSADNEIVWNKQTTPALGRIGAGENGSLTFNFTPRNFSTPSRQISSPTVTVEVNVRGKRLSESNVQEDIVTSAKRVVKIPSSLTLASRITRSVGPFENTGPVPPKADKQTTYTITWTVDNTVNTVSGAEVRALLPVYVKWLNKVSPAGEDITYNSNNGLVAWRVGNVDAFTSQNNRRRQVSFQVALEPSLSQVGQVPFIVQDTTLVGLDDFTGVQLTNTQPALTTNFSTDPAYRDGNDIVVP